MPSKYNQRKSLSSLGLFAILICVNFGCVPTPSAVDVLTPRFTTLHEFFMPTSPSQTYSWKLSGTDTLIYSETISMSGKVSASGLSPIWAMSRVGTKLYDSVANEVFISDSVVQIFDGNSASVSVSSQRLLSDTLRVGATWTGSPRFITRSGAEVSIAAKVEDYYSSFDNTYSDVFLVSYSPSVIGSRVPAEGEYQSGSKINRYFAKGVGMILEIVKDATGKIIFKKELTETRIN